MQEEQLKLAALEKELRSEKIIIDNLIEYGFSKTIAKRLITQHGEEVVRNALRAVDLQIQRSPSQEPQSYATSRHQRKVAS